MLRFDALTRRADANELGDVAWYAVTAAHRLDTTLTQLRAIPVHAPWQDVDDSIRGLIVAAGLFAGRVKKWLYHDKPLDHEIALRLVIDEWHPEGS